MRNLLCYPTRLPGGVRSSTFSKSGTLATATRSSEPATRSLLPASRSTGFWGAGRERRGAAVRQRIRVLHVIQNLNYGGIEKIPAHLVQRVKIGRASCRERV